ncbi:Endonuclease G [Echinococcus multilocularis]|uniref:Endonuclease n=1 Tax=Echinococcus multilocularis TaxID=6211 RepID=A0A087VYH6_ECHMU|nr:Endonuclease G [Echinococcus multilocularis]
MHRLFSSRIANYFFVASAAFSAGCLTTGVVFTDKRRLFVTIQRKTAPTSPDTPDLKALSRNVFSPQSPLPVPVSQVGVPTVESVKILPGFLCLYDRRSRIPRWTLEHLTKENLNGDAKDLVDRKEFAFVEDLGEPPEFRSTNLDYAKSGLDRGHMAAAGNNNYNAESMKKTFILSNIAPQVGYGFNRGIWNDLEKYVRGIARRSANVVVVTGPLFLPSSTLSQRGHRQVIYEVIGPNSVAVPTHFFKAVAVQGTPQGPWRTHAWVIPNREITEGTHVNTFAVPLKDVERAAGLIIFPNLY